MEPDEIEEGILCDLVKIIVGLHQPFIRSDK
jgi:hypothetical protein